MNNNKIQTQNHLCSSSNDYSSTVINITHQNDISIINSNNNLNSKYTLPVKITRNNRFLTDALFISVSGPNFIDYLRFSTDITIPIDKALSDSDFIQILDTLMLTKVNLIKLYIPQYHNKNKLKVILSIFITTHLVGYLDYDDEYELFIIPNDIHSLAYAKFHFLIDRYMIDGSVVPAWILLVSKERELVTSTNTTTINNNN